MAVGDEEHDRQLNHLLQYLVFFEKKHGSKLARHAGAIMRGKRSGGRPRTDDEADLAAVAAGEQLSCVAQRTAEATGENPASVRRRLKRKLGQMGICPTIPTDIEVMTEKPKPSTAAQLRDALRRKVSALRSRDYDFLIPRQCELEQAGYSPQERAEPLSHETMARELMNGSSHLLPGPPDDGGFELADVICERKAIRLVLDALEREELRSGALVLAEWLGNGGEDRWLASRRRVANAILEVRAAVVEARQIRNEAGQASGGIPLSLPGDRGDRQLIGAEAQAVLEAIAREGIISIEAVFP